MIDLNTRKSDKEYFGSIFSQAYGNKYKTLMNDPTVSHCAINVVFKVVVHKIRDKRYKNNFS